MKLLFTLFFLLCGLGAHAYGVDSTFAAPAPQTLYAPLTAENLASMTTDYTQTKYWKRRRWMAVSGVLCLAAGSVGVGIGAACGAWDGDIYKPVFVPGCILVSASIPLFVFANVNKRKAKRAVGLSLNVSPVEVRRPDGAKRQQPALGIYISF